jgi:DNA repair protein RadC
MPFAAGQVVRKALSIKELPLLERPRERLAQLGPQRLSVPELLAIVIGSGSGGLSALDVANELLARAGGSLRTIAAEPVEGLRAMRGIGPARAVAVHAAIELGRRVTEEEWDPNAPLRSARAVHRMVSGRLRDLPVEEFHVLALDTQCRLKRDILVTRGTLNSSLVHPREVFREAIVACAAAIILVHNHPSGDPTPSPEDIEVTRELIASGELLGVPIRDHVVIGRESYVSFVESKRM